MFSSNSGVDIPSEVCYNAPDLGWKETIYAVFIQEFYNMRGNSITTLHGLTKSKDHAEQVAKEIGGWIQETGWLGAGSF